LAFAPLLFVLSYQYVRNFNRLPTQYLKRVNKHIRLPFTATSFGSWWGADPKTRKQADIDVVAANRSEKHILLGECKWRGTVNAADEIERLASKKHLFDEYENIYFYLFVKNTKNIKLNKMESERIKIIGADMLFDV